MVVGQTGEYSDILVIGGGPGGYSAAIRAAQLGRSVTLVERGRLGGVCLNEGCIPSKALLSASRLLTRMRAASAMGIDAEPRLDFARLQQWKDGVVDRLSAGVAQLLERYRVQVKTGTAYFATERRVAVERDESFEFVEFGGAIIATGSRPLPIDGISFDGQHVLSPEQALALDALPERMVVAGGGYIGLELATACSRLGVSVTVVEAGERLLPELDPALGQVAGRGLRQLGVEMRLGARVRSYASGIVQIERAGDQESIEAEILVAAEARAPVTSELNLARTGIGLDADGRIVVDGRCRSNVASIGAIGDAVAGPLVAHRAIAQGRVAAESLCGLASAYDVSATPLVYFTEPEVMSVGLSEAEARAAGLQPVSARFPFGASGRAATLDDQQGFLQVVAEAETKRLLGIHAAGPLVSELAGEAALALEMGATLDDLALTLHPHPSLSEAISEAAWLALDIPLHVFRAR